MDPFKRSFQSEEHNKIQKDKDAALPGFGELEMGLNSWRAPNYRPIALLRDLKYAVNAKKGTAIEQSFLYLDSASADDWLALAS